MKITNLFVFGLFPFVTAARDGVFMSRMRNHPIVTDGKVVLVSIPVCLSLWIYDLGFFPVVCKTELDSLLVYVVHCYGQEVDWFCIGIKNTLFLY